MCEVNGSLVGKLVFFERIDKDGKPAYDGGERLVVRETPAVWYAVKLSGGFESHSLQAYPKLGISGWKVLSVSDGTKEAAALAGDLEVFATEKSGNWSSHVYTSARDVARQIRAMLKDTVAQEPITVNVRPGQTVVLVVQG